MDYTFIAFPAYSTQNTLQLPQLTHSHTHIPPASCHARFTR